MWKKVHRYKFLDWAMRGSGIEQIHAWCLKGVRTVIWGRPGAKKPVFKGLFDQDTGNIEYFEYINL